MSNINKSWDSSDAIMAKFQENSERLDSGEITVEAARVHAHNLKGAVKLLELEIAHAKETSRLQQGSNAVPGLRRGEHAAPAVVAAERLKNGKVKGARA